MYPFCETISHFSLLRQNHPSTRIQIRKKGKLPGDCAEASFDLEYGSATFAIQREAAVAEGKRVLIVDDLLATGGTLKVAPNSFSLLTPLTFSFYAFFAKLLPTFVAYYYYALFRPPVISS